MRIETMREVKTNIQNSTDFTISTDASKIFSMLASALYANKEKAVTYELGANCYDANPNEPFEIVFPTTLDPHIRFRDFGPGLCDLDVKRLLTVFGASDKSNSNTSIGGYGIGAKSPAAVTDTWNIISFHKGTGREYLIFVNDHGIPSLTSIREFETDQTGLEVIIPVPQSKFESWKSAVAEAFQYYPIKPIIKNASVTWQDVNYVSEGTCWGMKQNGFSGYQTAMTFITTHRLYNVDKQKLKLEFKDDQVLINMLNMPLVVTFDIGELQLSLSRESIQYTKHTINSIRTKLETVKKELIDNVKNHLANSPDGFVFRQKIADLDNKIFGKIGIQTSEVQFIVSRVIDAHYPEHNIVNINDAIKFYNVTLGASSKPNQMCIDLGLKVYNGTRLGTLSTRFTCFKNHSIVLRDVYDYNSKCTTYYIRFFLRSFDKIAIIINDVRDGVARGKHFFDSKKHSFIVFANKNIFPSDLQKYIINASDLDRAPRKHRDITSKEPRKIIADNAYYFRRNSFAKVEVLPTDDKVAYVTFTNSKTDTSIIENNWYTKRAMLQSLGWTVIGVKSDKPINKKYIQIDKALKKEFKKYHTPEYAEKYHSHNLLYHLRMSNDTAVKIIMKASFNSAHKNSVWNEIKSQIDTLKKMCADTHSTIDYDKFCQIMNTTPLTAKFSIDNISEKLYNRYEMLKVVSSYSSNFDEIERYINLIDSVN